jgi:hypothetical protein
MLARLRTRPRPVHRRPLVDDKREHIAALQIFERV